MVFLTYLINHPLKYLFLYSIQHEMRSIREHLKKIGDNSEQTCKVREHLKKIGDNSEQNRRIESLIIKTLLNESFFRR